MSIEVMKQWREAFEALQSHGDIAILVTPEREFNFARISKELRQAIAELEKREPAAWGMENDDGQIYDCITPEEHAKKEGQYTVALYREPQPNVTTSDTKQEHVDKTAKQRHEWVGLTEGQFQQARDDANASFRAWNRGIRGQQFVPQDDPMWHFWKAIQNKLKELNT